MPIPAWMRNSWNSTRRGIRRRPGLYAIGAFVGALSMFSVGYCAGNRKPSVAEPVAVEPVAVDTRSAKIEASMHDPYDKLLTVTDIGDTRYNDLEDMNYKGSDVTILAGRDVDGNGVIDADEQFRFVLRGYRTSLYEKLGANAESLVKDGTERGRTPQISITRPSEAGAVASPLQVGMPAYGIRVRNVGGHDVWDITDTSLVNWTTVDQRKVSSSNTEAVRYGAEIRR